MFCRFPAFLLHFGVATFWCTRWPPKTPVFDFPASHSKSQGMVTAVFPYETTKIPWPVSKSSNIVYLFVYYFYMSHAYIYLYIKRTHSHMHIWYIIYICAYTLTCASPYAPEFVVECVIGPDFWAYLSSAADVYHMVLIILIACIMTNCYMVSLQLNTSFSPRRSQNTVTACCAGLEYIHNTYVL